VFKPRAAQAPPDPGEYPGSTRHEPEQSAAKAEELGLARETLSRLLIVFKRQELVNNNCQSVEPFAKQSFRPNSALCSKFYPQNINYMPVVKFFACLDFERKSTFCKRLCNHT
jgi:hypothetical protein